MPETLNGKRILLIVGGGIAAYKACELVRLIRKAGGSVRCVLTAGGAQFVTPMTLAALSEQPVHTSLWDLKDEAEMGHIQLSREADLVVLCPATADLLAKMTAGIADDLATTLLLATDKKVLAAPAMNVRMWQHEDQAQRRPAPGGRRDDPRARRGRNGLRRIWSRTPPRPGLDPGRDPTDAGRSDRKSTRLNSSHMSISYAVFCLKKKKKK